MIVINQLEIGFKSTILSIDSIALSKGCVYALVGRNGIGKSTLLKTLSKQIKKIKGTVTIDDQEIEKISQQELPKTIAFVSSKFVDVAFLKVEDYLRFGKSTELDLFGRLNEKEQLKIDHTVSLFGLEHLCSKYTSELSDGEKQLVAITRAVIQDTPVILLDEPTAFLDYANKQLVLNSIIDIAKNLGKTILFSTHDIDMITRKGIDFLLIDQASKKGVLRKCDILKQDIIDTCF